MSFATSGVHEKFRLLQAGLNSQIFLLRDKISHGYMCATFVVDMTLNATGPYSDNEKEMSEMEKRTVEKVVKGKLDSYTAR